MAGAIISSTSVDWNTPQWLVDKVVETLGIINLDPCSNPHSVVPAVRKVQLPEDGLAVPWGDYYGVYVNPPYGRGIASWISKGLTASAVGANVIMVIPAAVDTKHWHSYVWPSASRICFLKGRVKFDLPGNPASQAATHATAVVLFSESYRVASQFDTVFKDSGFIVSKVLD